MPAPQWPGQRTLSPRHDSVKVGRRKARGGGDFAAGFVAAWRRELAHGNNRRDTRSAAAPARARLDLMIRPIYPMCTTPDSAIDQTRLRLSSGKGYSMYLAVARATASP